MAALPRRRMTEEAYLLHDAASAEKSEFANGELIAIAGVSHEHELLRGNLEFAIRSRVPSGRCRVYGSDLRVHLDETGLYAYPDLSVVCGPPELSDTNLPSLRNPQVLVEILSDSTEDWDRGGKAAHYRRLGTVALVVLVDSRRRAVELQSRNPDGSWTLREVTAGDVSFAGLGVVVPVEEIYAGWDPPRSG